MPKNEKGFDKKGNEQAQTQPVFQNKLANDLSNKALNLPRSLANQTPNEKPGKFFENKPDNIDIKTKNLTTEITALDKILLSKEGNLKSNNLHTGPPNANTDNYLSKVKERTEINSANIPVLNTANKPKNKLQEIKTEDTVDAYLQMKMNTASTAKARKILPSQEKNKPNDDKTKTTEKRKEIENKETKKEPLKIEKTIDKKPAVVKPNNTAAPQKLEVKLPPSEAEGEEKLYECTEGCGRKFNAKALEKHAKVCKKVFQSKPKEDKNVKNAPEEKKTDKKENGQKKGKWQKQSEAFRAVVKAAKNQFGDEEEGEKKEKKETNNKDNKKKGKK